LDGQIILKTDDVQLFNFSLNEFKAAGLMIDDVTYDLHSSEAHNNIMTNYERRFVKIGKPICRAVAYKNK